MTRWMHPPEFERQREHDRFDAVVEGSHYGLSRELALAIWKRVCDDATDEKGRIDDMRARQRFHEIAARIAARGGRLVPDVGRQTRVGVELTGGEPSGGRARRIDELTSRVPGRTTLVAAEAQRWQSAESTVAESPAEFGVHAARSDLPGAEDVAHALAALQPQTEALEATWRADRRLFDVDLIAGAWQGGERDRDHGKLPAALLAQMERAYGQRFDDVELHVDSAEVPAGHEAFTQGRHIHFETGAFDPSSEHGEHVVAHELAHVVQQSIPSLGGGRVSRSALEADAHQAAINVIAGRAAMVHLAAPKTAALGFSHGESRHPPTPSHAAPPTMRGTGPAPHPPAASAGGPATSPHPSCSRMSPPGIAVAPPGAATRTRPPSTPAGAVPAGAVPAGAVPAGAVTRGPGNDGLLMPEAPAALTPAAAARLQSVSAGNHGVAGAITTLPTADQQTAVARNAVVEPQVEQDARAQHTVVAGVDNRPPPSPEIEAACARIREVIRAKRPPSEDRLVDARPREMAQQAGEQMSAGVEQRAGSVRQSYADMQQHPQGQPSRAPVPATLPPTRAETPHVDAGAGAPDPLQHRDVSLDSDVAAQQRRIQDAGMNTEPGRLVNDGPIGDARGGASDLQTMSQTNAQQVLAQQAAAVAHAQSDMRALQTAAVQAMAQARAGTVAHIATHTSGVKTSEEQQRATAGAQMQAIFTRTQSSIDRLLQPLSGAAVARWEAGVAGLSTAFESALAEVRHRIDERHHGDGSLLGEIGAGLTSLGDQVFGLPDWVVRDYDRAEAAFADGATSLIRDISRDVNAVIEDCKHLIARARTDIDAIVHSLPANLQVWAQGEAARLGRELDQLGQRVDQTQHGLNQDLINRANTAVQQVREQVAGLREQARGLVGRIADAITQFLENPGRAIIDGLLRLVGIPPTNFWALVDRLGNVIDGIAADPMRFANTLMAGVGQGFQQFFHNLPTHLGQALFQWLFSKLGEAGVTIPADFSLRSILGLVLDVLGISWTRIRTILARHIGEQNAQLLDRAYQIISTLIERGPQGLIDMFVEQLNPATIVDMIKEAALRYIMEAIVTRVTARILMMLNPAGAILQAIEAIYRVVKWVIDNAARIFTLIESIVSGAEQILAGNTSGVANLVESSLVRLIVPVIDFLAGYLGLGGIPNAIRDLILGLQQRVEQIMDRVIGFVIDRARALLASLGIGGNSRPNQPGADDGEIGEHLGFTAGHESHTLWVDTSGATPVVMMASTPRSLDDHLTSLRSRRDQLAAANPEINGQTDGLFGQVQTLAQTVVQKAEEAKSKTIDSPERQAADRQVEVAEEALREPLKQLLELLGIEVPQEITPPVQVQFNYHSGLRATPTAADHIAGFTRPDFLSQLTGQERRLNAMTVGEWQRNRDSFTERSDESDSGRDPIADALQAEFRATQRQAIVNAMRAPEDEADTSELAPASVRFLQGTFSRLAQYRATGIPRATAESLVDDWLATQAALHDPDQIAGGHPNGLTDLGSRRINSSIGSQWRTRVAQLDEGVHNALHEIPGTLWNGIRMRVRLFV